MMLAIFLGLVGTAFGEGGTVVYSTGMYSNDACDVLLTSDGGGLIDQACASMDCSIMEGQEGDCSDDDFCTLSLSFTLGSDYELAAGCCGIYGDLDDDVNPGTCTDLGGGMMFFTLSITGCEGQTITEEFCSQFDDGSDSGEGSGDGEDSGDDSGDDEPFVTEPTVDDQDKIEVTVMSYGSQDSCDAGTDQVGETEVLELYMGCQTWQEGDFTLSLSIDCVEGEDKATRKVFMNGDCSGDPMGEQEMENGGCVSEFPEGDGFENVSWTGYNCITNEPEPEGEDETEPESESSAAVLSLVAAFAVAFMH